MDQMHNTEMEKKKQDFLEKLKIEQDMVIKVMNIPQGTPEWLQWRLCRMTASNYGAVAGHNPYKSPKQLLGDLLWNTFKGNNATKWGSEHESDAAKIYEKFISGYHEKEGTMEFFYPGLIISQNQPWLAVSPDGLPALQKYNKTTDTNSLLLRFLLEIKCPFSKKLYPHIPHYYFDQIQGIMGILNLPFCDFVVWTPEKSQVRRYNFDSSYWVQVLFPKLRKFFMDEYLPRLILKEEGQLLEGEIDPVMQINIDSIRQPIEVEQTESITFTITSPQPTESIIQEPEQTILSSIQLAKEPEPTIPSSEKNQNNLLNLLDSDVTIINESESVRKQDQNKDTQKLKKPKRTTKRKTVTD